jgi:sortase B
MVSNKKSNISNYSLNQLNNIALNTLTENHDNSAKKFNTKSLKNKAINYLFLEYSPKESQTYKKFKLGKIMNIFIICLSLIWIGNYFWQINKQSVLATSLKSASSVSEEKTATDNIVTNNNLESATSSEIKSNSMTTLPTFKSVDFTQLIAQNSDTVGWIFVNNTNVDYAITQTTNNDYYLSHSFDKSLNESGWIFADFRDDMQNFAKNTIIYGHGRKEKTMFGSLTNALEESWYSNLDNQIIQISTPKQNTMWQIFSIYKIKAETYYITTDFDKTADFITFENQMINRSIYNFGVNLDANDKLLTLSTCYDNNGTRIVIHAKLLNSQLR